MPEDKKQGSGEPVAKAVGEEACRRLMEQIEAGMKNYDWATENNIATEMARLFIPSAYGLYVRWYWTASLQSVIHFVEQRMDDHAQVEIQDFAKAVKELAASRFPVSMDEFMARK